MKAVAYLTFPYTALLTVTRDDNTSGIGQFEPVGSINFDYRVTGKSNIAMLTEEPIDAGIIMTDLRDRNGELMFPSQLSVQGERWGVLYSEPIYDLNGYLQYWHVRVNRFQRA